MIRYCPNCGSNLVPCQGVKRCPECKGKYYILETQQPEKEKTDDIVVLDEVKELTICGADVKSYNGPWCIRCESADECFQDLAKRGLMLRENESFNPKRK